MNIERASRRFFPEALRLAGILSLVILTNLSTGADYRVVHCPHGCPISDAEDNRLIFRQTYALSFSATNFAPAWVAYHMVAEGVGIATGLPRGVIFENVSGSTLNAEEFALLEEQGSVRVQLAPLVNFAGTPYWLSSNYATNSVVMPPALASGAWAGLEWASRNLVARQGELYVIAGPILKQSIDFDSPQRGSEPSFPDGYFKVIYTINGEVSYFLFEADLPVHVHHCDRRATREQIEDVSGLTLMPRVDNVALKTLDKKLGCI